MTVAANQVRLLDERSQVLYQNSVRFLHPDLVSGGGVAVAYDIGGTALYALDSKGLRWQQETEGELLAVTVNPHRLCDRCLSTRAARRPPSRSGTATARRYLPSSPPSGLS